MTKRHNIRFTVMYTVQCKVHIVWSVHLMSYAESSLSDKAINNLNKREKRNKIDILRLRI